MLDLRFLKWKAWAIITGHEEDYVVLKEDNKGRYIEYFIKKGAPHDNRCLSWYDSYQENAYIRNGWVDGLSEEDKRKRLAAIKQKRDNKVGGLFKLSSFTCGFEEFLKMRLEESEEAWKEFHPGEPFVPEYHICKVGHPAPKCKECQCKHWTYEEPVKCACWSLKEVDLEKELEDVENLRIPIGKIEDYKFLLEKLMKNE